MRFSRASKAGRRQSVIPRGGEQGIAQPRRRPARPRERARRAESRYFRHCEEQSDEAIQNPFPTLDLLRGACHGAALCADPLARKRSSAPLPLRRPLLGRLPFLCGLLRNLLSFGPRLGKPDRDRLLAALDLPPRTAALQGAGLALLHRAPNLGGCLF